MLLKLAPNSPTGKIKMNSFCGQPLLVGLLTTLLLFGLISPASAFDLPEAAPKSVSMSREQLARMDTAISEEISQHRLPGAVVLVARKGKIVWHKADGSRAVEPAREAMTADTIFDVASLT